MKIRCISVRGESLPISCIRPELGLSVETQFNLKIGKEYVVYGITIFLGHAWYYIADESFSYFPVWNPACLFEIIDNRLSNEWVVGYRGCDPKIDSSLLIAFPEWVNDHEFYSRLIDGDAEAVEKFDFYKKRLDREFQ